MANDPSEKTPAPKPPADPSKPAAEGASVTPGNLLPNPQQLHQKRPLRPNLLLQELLLAQRPLSRLPLQALLLPPRLPNRLRRLHRPKKAQLHLITSLCSA